VKEPEGFAEYVVARRDALVRTAYLLTGDRQLAEDLVQATLVRVWPRWERIESVENVDAYVRRVLMSIFLSWRKRRWWREVVTDVLPEPPVNGDGDGNGTGDDAGSARGDDRAVLLNAIGRLPPRQRAVIALRYFLDLTEADTAHALGCSVGTVKSHSSRALAKLRSLIPVEVP
jgi:RNA polymerase sigma-70 factor (sigma-E family)